MKAVRAKCSSRLIHWVPTVAVSVVVGAVVSGCFVSWLTYFSLAMRVEVRASRAFLTSGWLFCGLRTHALAAPQRRWASRIVLVARERRAADHSEVRERRQTVASTVAVGAAPTDSLSRFQQNATRCAEDRGVRLSPDYSARGN